MTKKENEGQTCPGDDALEVKEAILRNAIDNTRNAAEFAKEEKVGDNSVQSKEPLKK